MFAWYKKLLNDLEMHKRFKEAALVEYDYNKQLFDKHKKINNRDTISNKPLDRILEELKHYENMIYIEEENIKNLEEKIKLIDECIEQADITVKVAQLRAMGLTQEQVGELIDISDRHVRRIEAKFKNK
ncbi:helix-turn-helix domain-containing protein [Clostridium sp. SYSU_GA19001]|uniref:helix-turn-helix domain-containing protein n=1 Tax=Clostridium caldaquaticum TaxID=2940653 RepID=UPI0020774DAF|nr:helix-turn-helix transcriptional regulator [Clostridium caldaquaticum]MCM8710527.1 helix-turn-helix domain-containing protein [Clostridium caldaquaticum]